MSKSPTVSYEEARKVYADWGVDTDAAIKTALQTPISMHCWQGDDVGGFENEGQVLGSGLAVTGNYPGKARTADELRADFEKAASLIPGAKRMNLHALYAETGGRKVDRDALEPDHFSTWIDWAKTNGFGLDFNPSYFSHPKADDGFTLSHPDKGIRDFWIAHGKATRHIAAAMGKALGSPCVNNVWIPDGYKDIPADRKSPRDRLRASLDEIFAEDISPDFLLDAVESKLFGIGSESYVVGSHEFYLGYAITRKKVLCLDAGHFHPTEGIADKFSSVLQWVDRLLLHVSRGVRWDSDHVVLVNDDLTATAQELVRGGYLDRVSIGLDFFDASINRIAAWVIGTRSMRKALLAALLDPVDMLRKAEAAGDYTARLAYVEEAKTLPFGAVWDHVCEVENMPVGRGWIDEVKAYEKNVLSKRS